MRVSDVQVAVVGESLVDVITGPGRDRSARPGGSPLNVAVGLGRLGVRTGLTTQIGSDHNGELIRAHLAEAGVHLSHGGGRTGRTSTASADITPDGSAVYEFDVEWNLDEFDVGEAAIVHTGSLATLLEPGASRVYNALCSLPRDTVVTFDPNVRPALSPSAAAARNQFEKFSSMAHIVKMSDEDAAFLYPGLGVRELAARSLSRGPRVFVLTRGGQGCSVASAGLVTNLPAESVDVVDTIGAGDSFMSGLIYALAHSGASSEFARGHTNPELIYGWVNTGLRSAAITVTRHGANPPTRSELG